jgi:transmembrane 9 superfamily member 3
VVCTLHLSDKNFDILDAAIRKAYWFEHYIGMSMCLHHLSINLSIASMYFDEFIPTDRLTTPFGIFMRIGVDDLPLWAFLGVVDEGVQKTLVFTSLDFRFGYNGRQIVDATVIPTDPVEVERKNDVVFKYSVSWFQSDVKFEHRMDKLLDAAFFENSVHWFSVFNSFMLVVFLVGMASVILLRVLRRSLSELHRDMEAPLGHGMESDSERESDYGWKLVQMDIGRNPPHLEIFSALLGVGSQLLCLMFVVSILAVMVSAHFGRGALLNTALISYVLTAYIDGHVSGRHYLQKGGKQWIRNAVMASCIFPGITVGIVSVANIVAMWYGSSMAIPFFTILLLFVIWIFLTVPLVFVGVLVGRNLGMKDVSKAGGGGLVRRPGSDVRPGLPRTIPMKPWYLRPALLVVLAGALPFGSVFIEIYYVFVSFWNYKVYYVYGFMLLILVILVVVTSCVGIVIAYLFLNSEDYRWQWMSFLSGASIGMYVLGYSVYFYFQTSMSGFLQLVMFASYVTLFSVLLSLACGMLSSALVRFSVPFVQLLTFSNQCFFCLLCFVCAQMLTQERLDMFQHPSWCERCMEGRRMIKLENCNH